MKGGAMIVGALVLAACVLAAKFSIYERCLKKMPDHYVACVFIKWIN